MEIIEFIKSSFWHVLPVLAAGAFAIAIIIERTRALYMLYPLKNPEQFFHDIRSLILHNQLSEALDLCDRLPQKPIAQVTKQAILRAHQPESLIENGVEIAVQTANHALQKRTQFLATIANVATLLGLFGTIAGLIASFEAVAHADAQQKSALLAAGISQAMNATMLGLAIAIPCMVAFSFLMNRTNQLTSEVDQSAIRILDVLKQRLFAQDLNATNPRLRHPNDDERDFEDSATGTSPKVGTNKERKSA